MSDSTDGTDRYADVYRSRWTELVRLATRVLGDPSAAEDVAQDALARLRGQAVLHAPDDEVAAWLRRVTVNAAFNHLRGDRRRRRREERVLREALRSPGARPGSDPGSDFGSDPPGVVVRAEEAERVRRVLVTLPERQRLCLLLRHSGYTYREIAEATGLAVGSVGVLLTRAEQAFRRGWTDPSGGDLPTKDPVTEGAVSGSTPPPRPRAHDLPPAEPPTISTRHPEAAT